MDFSSVTVNYVAVIVATVVAFVVGWLWHGPIFGKKWMALEGLTLESMKAMKMKPGTAILLGFVMTLLTAWVLGWMGAAFNSVGTGVAGAFHLAFWPWLGFSMTSLANKWIWEGRSFALFAFNAIYGFVSLFVMALVIVFWN